MDRAQREVKQLLPVSAVLSLVNCYLCFPKCCSLLTGKAGPANLWQNNCSHLSPSLPPSLLFRPFLSPSPSLSPSALPCLILSISNVPRAFAKETDGNSDHLQTGRDEQSLVPRSLLCVALKQETHVTTAALDESIFYHTLSFLYKLVTGTE